MKHILAFTGKPSVYSIFSSLLFVFMSLGSLNVLAQMPSPKVEYQELATSQVRLWRSFSARISPVESVDIRPQVSGRIDQVLFTEGDQVKKGQALFVIDPRPFEASVKKAEAALATAKAQARLTEAELKRSRTLIDSKLVSQSIYDEALMADQVAAASILQVESSLLEAQLNLEYAFINAPISGRVGREALTAGNIVGAGSNAPILTSIIANDRVYAEIRVDEQTFLEFLRDSRSSQEMPALLSLSDDSSIVYEGHVYTFDNQLDPASGTIRARAIFDNPDGILTPGMYANVALGSVSQEKVFLIPERAIGTNQDKKFVYIIDENNVVQYRQVTLGEQYQAQRIIRSGLQEGEHIVVNGLSHIRPNVEVDPVAVKSTKEIVSTEL